MSRWIGTNRDLIPLYTELSGYDPFSSLAQVIFEFDGQKPIAAALYDHYNGHSIHSHVWIAEGEKPSRVWWWAIHDYIFNVLKVKLAVLLANSNNPKSMRLAESLGYELTATIPNYYGTSDALFYTGTEDMARHWQRYRSGKTPPPTYAKIHERMPA